MKTYFYLAAMLLLGITACKKTGDTNPEDKATGLTYQWTINIGGNGNEEVNQVKTDAAGNVYVWGTFQGTVDFDPGSVTYNLTATSAVSVFIAKYGNDGKFIFAKNISAGDAAYYGMAIDAAGNVYLTGDFSGTANFDAGSQTLVSAGKRDIFFAKYSNSGTLAYIHRIGGAGYDGGRSIAVDPTGNVYLGGEAIGSSVIDFDLGAEEHTLNYPGTFLVKYSGNGNYIFAKNLSAGSFNGMSITTDAMGNVYAGGLFFVEEYYQSIPNRGPDKEDYYVPFVKYNAMGNYVYAIGNVFTDDYLFYAVVVDKKDNLYITGKNFENGLSLVKYNDKKQVLYRYDLGDKPTTTLFNQEGEICIDPLGDVRLSGSFWGTIDFDPSDKVTALTSSTTTGANIFYTAQYAVDGKFVSVKEMEGLTSMATSGNDFFVASSFTGTKNIDIGNGTQNFTGAGGSDIFIAKYRKLE